LIVDERSCKKRKYVGYRKEWTLNGMLYVLAANYEWVDVAKQALDKKLLHSPA